MSQEELDIDANRNAVKYSFREKLTRLLWAFVKPLFSLSPRPLFAWRAQILRCFGATVGQNVHIYNSAIIYFPWNLEIGNHSAIGEDVLIYNLGPISIGEKVTISHRAHLCAGTHDYTDKTLPLLRPAIVVKDQAWVCADAFVGPNVTVNEGAIVGARAVVTKDVEPWTIVAGNPAKFIKRRELKKT